jgi:hypothetical protein
MANEPLWPFIERKKSMRNLVKYVGIGLLVVGLAACDNSDTKTPAQGASAESNATGQPVTCWMANSVSLCQRI